MEVRHIISRSLSPGKAKPREAAEGQIDRHLAAKKMLLGIWAAALRPDRTGTVATYYLKLLLPAPRAGPDPGVQRALTSSGQRSPTSPASLSRVAQSSPERNLLSQRGGLSLNASPSTGSGGWKERRWFVGQSPSQSEAPNKVIGTPPKGRNGASDH